MKRTMAARMTLLGGAAALALGAAACDTADPVDDPVGEDLTEEDVIEDDTMDEDLTEEDADS